MLQAIRPLTRRLTSLSKISEYKNLIMQKGNPMENQVTSQAFWESEWQRAIDRSGPALHGTDEETAQKPMERWNKMAKDFAERTSKQKSTERRDKTIQLLVDKEVLTPDTRVLDIGAGPGAWALPMARHCAHVTALEPAKGMTDIIATRMKEEGVTNITIDQRTWQEVNLEQSGYKNAFDLVFASMTPGIDGPETLKKMIHASKSFCYMSGFSGPGMHQQFAPLWQKFFDTPMPQKTKDIIYPFNLLYAMGFRPDLTFSWWNREISWDRDHTIRHFVNFFESHMEITPGVRAIIADYVDTRCPNGEYRPEKPVCRGAMIWSVHKDGPKGGGNEA